MWKKWIFWAKSKEHTLYNTIKKWLTNFWESTKDWLKRSTWEALIFCLIWLGMGGVSSHYHEKSREKFPLWFSEIWAVERKADKDWIVLWPINVYQMKTNDLCMKIFEAYNEGLESEWFTDKSEIFAARLYDAFTYRNIYKYNLKDLLDQVPTYYPAIIKELDVYLQTLPKIQKANTMFDKSWDERHYDNYHTEVRTRMVTDAKWNSHVETYTEQVYDDTDHYFTYNKKYWEQGAKILDQQYKSIPILELTEEIRKTEKTNAEWEYAAEKSRLQKTISQEELLKIANSRYTGSTILDDVNKIKILYPKLEKQKNKWNKVKSWARSVHYNTTSHYHSWPYEFQVVEGVLQIWNVLEWALRELSDVVEETNLKVPLLQKKINKFIEKGYIESETTSYNEKKQLRDEIIVLTKEIYKLNFKKGLDVDRYRYRVLVLWFILGGLLWWWVGLGIDYITDKFELYDKIKFAKFSKGKN